MIAATDYGGKFLNTSTPVINSAGIIDFGATDHMTFDSRQGSILRPSSQKKLLPQPMVTQSQSLGKDP